MCRILFQYRFTAWDSAFLSVEYYVQIKTQCLSGVAVTGVVDNIQCLSHLTQNGVCGSQCVCGSVSTAVGLAAIH